MGKGVESTIIEPSDFEMYMASMNRLREEVIKDKEEVQTNVDKIEGYRLNIEERIDEYNQNADNKIVEYNQNTVGKIDEFNQHADERKEELNTIAEGVQDMATAIQFATFEVTDNMELAINTADKLVNTSFSVNEETGKLEVEIV